MDFNVLVKLVEEQGIKLATGLAVLIIGFFLAKSILKLISRNERFLKIEPTLKGFLLNVLKLAMYTIVILTAVNIMGIPLTSFVTLLASAGVAISLAMQGALSNFVGGITILLLKPFRAGDYVKIGDTEGSVKSIGVFFTEFVTPDNRHISLPNSNLTTSAIINYTREGSRRMDILFGVSYDSDIDRVEETLMDAVRQTNSILPDPAPMVRLTACGDSSLTFTIRVWCKSPDYWDVQFDLIENGKRALDAAGIEIPYPQVDVHMR